jgi:hypothetical protein
MKETRYIIHCHHCYTTVIDENFICDTCEELYCEECGLHKDNIYFLEIDNVTRMYKSKQEEIN